MDDMEHPRDMPARSDDPEQQANHQAGDSARCGEGEVVGANPLHMTQSVPKGW